MALGVESGWGLAPARSDEMALTWHHFPIVPDRAARVRVFLQAYGGLPSFDVAEAIATRMEAAMAREHANLLAP